MCNKEGNGFFYDSDGSFSKNYSGNILSAIGGAGLAASVFPYAKFDSIAKNWNKYSWVRKVMCIKLFGLGLVAPYFFSHLAGRADITYFLLGLPSRSDPRLELMLRVEGTLTAGFALYKIRQNVFAYNNKRINFLSYIMKKSLGISFLYAGIFVACTEGAFISSLMKRMQRYKEKNKPLKEATYLDDFQRNVASISTIAASLFFSKISIDLYIKKSLARQNFQEQNWFNPLKKFSYSPVAQIFNNWPLKRKLGFFSLIIVAGQYFVNGPSFIGLPCFTGENEEYKFIYPSDMKSITSFIAGTTLLTQSGVRFYMPKYFKLSKFDIMKGKFLAVIPFVFGLKMIHSSFFQKKVIEEGTSNNHGVPANG